MNMAKDKEDQYREKAEGEEGLTQQTPEKAPAPEEKEVQERRERRVEARVAQEEELSRPQTPQLPQEEEKEAKSYAEQMEGVAPEGKLERLLSLAETKGLVFVNKVIANMESRDAFIVDKFHDTLAQDARFKRFLET
ncbi:MAG: hypothetical protein AAB567_02840 [Patescibacteria group bacterium]